MKVGEGDLFDSDDNLFVAPDPTHNTATPITCHDTGAEGCRLVGEGVEGRRGGEEGGSGRRGGWKWEEGRVEVGGRKGA